MKNEEIKKIQKEEYPKGNIILKDGRMLDCYPVASEDDLKEDNLKLDKSDRFFTLGKKRLNAYFLWFRCLYAQKNVSL